MNETVWISTAMGHASNQRPMMHSFSADRPAFGIDCGNRNEQGEPLESDCFPEEVFGAPNAKETDYKLPNLFFAGSYWIVSAAAADVFHRFNLGEGRLYPVKVFKKDRMTPVGDGWFAINFSNQKNSLIPGESLGIRLRAQNRYKSMGALKDGDLAFDQSALSGADIWLESRMWDCLLFSDTLANALRRAKADAGFMLKSCRVL